MKHRAGYAALAGRPNVGKSTLLNRLLGQKLVITSHKPQTTRHSILGINTLGEGQVIYVDTPGIHQRGNKALNRYLNRAAQTAIAGVDLIVFVLDVSTWTDEDQIVLEHIRETGLPALVAANKMDLVRPRENLLPMLARLSSHTGIEKLVPVSAQSGDNCEELQQQILESLPVGENIFPEDQVSDRPERFFAAELIREQIIRRYHKELPYAVTIEIEQFEELPHVIRILAIIWVERDNQKGILVGKGGQSLKETSTEARRQLEDFFQQKIYLRLWVKVKKSWSSDHSSLAQLGYND